MAEELKKRAVERIKKMRGLDFAKGREKAFQMIADGQINLEDIEEYAKADPEAQDHAIKGFLGSPELSISFLEGFVQGLSEASYEG